MALFTDGLICDQESLREYESSILEVARTEELELTPKLRVAQREIGFEVAAFLQRNGSCYLAPDQSLGNVSVTEPLRHWHALHSLAVIYRDAYFRHLNDRFREKWAEYALLGRQAQHRCFTAGVGIVAQPQPRPDPPTWDLVAGGALPKRVYLMSVATQGDDGASAASEPIVVEADAGKLVRLQLKPCAGNRRWVIYLGNDAESLTKQTPSPLAGGTAWTETPAGLGRDGEAPSPGQRPDVIVRLMNRVDRG